MEAEDRAGPRVRASPASRRDSMRSFERLQGQVLLAASAAAAITMTTVICMTTRLLG